MFSSWTVQLYFLSSQEKNTRRLIILKSWINEWSRSQVKNSTSYFLADRCSLACGKKFLLYYEISSKPITWRYKKTMFHLISVAANDVPLFNSFTNSLSHGNCHLKSHMVNGTLTVWYRIPQIEVPSGENNVFNCCYYFIDIACDCNFPPSCFGTFYFLSYFIM